MSATGGWSQTPMPQATVLVEVFGDSQVAARIKEDVHLPVWGATSVRGDGLPGGIDLN